MKRIGTLWKGGMSITPGELYNGNLKATRPYFSSYDVIRYTGGPVPQYYVYISGNITTNSSPHAYFVGVDNTWSAEKIKEVVDQMIMLIEVGETDD